MSDQLGLFSTEAHARRSDPVTSHLAAASLSPARLRRSQEWVLRVFDHYPQLHDEALQARYVDLGLPPQSVSGIRTRRCELVDRGYLRDSGQRVRLRSGRLSIVWERR